MKNKSNVINAEIRWYLKVIKSFNFLSSPAMICCNLYLVLSCLIEG